jgi:hypothetical protein
MFDQVIDMTTPARALSIYGENSDEITSLTARVLVGISNCDIDARARECVTVFLSIATGLMSAAESSKSASVTAKRSD